MSEPNKEGDSFDPFEAWRTIRDASMDAWAKGMIQAVNSAEYAKATGAMLDAYLAASIPFREMLEKTMGQTLQQMNMPTRTDFISFAERMTQIEMRLDDLDTKLDDLAKNLSKPSPAPAKRKKKAK